MEEVFLFSSVNNEENPVFNIILAGITYPDPTYHIERKHSDIYVLEYVEEGEGTVILDGERYNVGRGDAYLLSAKKKHEYYSSPEAPWKKSWMNISGSLCHSLITLYGIGDRCYFPDMPIGDLFKEFFEFCKANNDINRINEYGAIIFHRMLQRISANEPLTESVGDKIKKFIDSNFYEKLTISDIADRIGLSVSQLNRVFKAKYGNTVYSYILNRKIEAAENMLKNTTLSVKKISEILNFTDEHYFSNIFKAKRGVSPKAFRES